MDNILIVTEDNNIEEHIKIVSIVLKHLKDNDLFLQPEKCSFHRRKVDYLGVIVGNGQVKMDPIKVKGVTDWPVPTTLRELCSFLGFGNYYKDFIANYSIITHPLHELTKKSRAWSWQDNKQIAFDTLKERFTSYPVLQSPNPEKQYIVDTDASAVAVGATVQQEFTNGLHPITFFSKSLLPAECNYDIYDCKLLAIIYALKANRHLLLGTCHKFLIRCDHNNLKYFKLPQKISTRQACWHEFLQDYHFELQHFPGKSNTIADLLSQRKDFEGGVNINENVTLLPEKVFINTNYLRTDRKLPIQVNKVYLEDDPETRHKVLQEIHDLPIRGHPGISNIWNLVKCNYEEPRLCKFIEAYMKGCVTCQETKVITHIKRTLLYHLDTFVEQGPFQYVSMDLITDLPPSNKYDLILTIVDQGCSKAAKFIPCNKTIDGQGVASLYLQHLFPWFGIPKRIISDHDPRFTSHLVKAICTATNIQQNISSIFHPCTDGQTKCMNLWIENYLKKFVNGRQDNWSTLLSIAEFAHNSWKHKHTKHTPHQLIFGINPTANLSIPDDENPNTQQRLMQLSKA